MPSTKCSWDLLLRFFERAGLEPQVDAANAMMGANGVERATFDAWRNPHNRGLRMGKMATTSNLRTATAIQVVQGVLRATSLARGRPTIMADDNDRDYDSNGTDDWPTLALDADNCSADTTATRHENRHVSDSATVDPTPCDIAPRDASSEVRPRPTLRANAH